MAFNSLEIGKRGLLAQRFGLDVTSNNIANANTPGYSRRTAMLKETSPTNQYGNLLGTGVQVEKILNYRHDFYDKEIRNTISRNSGYALNSEFAARIESIFGEPSDTGLTESINKFFNAFNDLAQNPEDTGMRNVVMNRGKTLTQRINTIAESLSSSRDEALDSAGTKIERANTLIKDIAEINKRINAGNISQSSEAQTLVDEQELKLEELAKIIDVTAKRDDNGLATVFTNGINLITGSSYSQLRNTIVTDQATGEQTMTIEAFQEGDSEIVEIQPQAGELASLAKLYNITLDDKDSSGEFSAFTELNDFVSSFANSVNSILQNGYGLHDTGPNPPGRNFFEPQQGGINAFNIQISADISDPADIPLSSAVNEPGNSEIARQIANLKNDDNFLNGQNPVDYLAGFFGRVGLFGEDAISGERSSRLVLDQLENQRESVIGVNLDEEAVNLIRFQKAFEASSRVVSITNEILGTLVNLGR
jgi:flagellar hook-associated protein 1 FlgK